MKRNVALYVRDILQSMEDAEDFIRVDLHDPGWQLIKPLIWW